MEAEERPSKLQKRAHDGDNGSEDATFLAIPETEPNSKFGEESRDKENPTIQYDQTLTTENSSQINPDVASKGTLTTTDSSVAQSTNTPGDNAGSEPPPLSKNQQKKLRRQQEWEEGRPARKLLKKEKKKASQQRKREARAAALLAQGQQEGDPSAASTSQNGDAGPSAEKSTSISLSVPRNRGFRAIQLPITILFDCDFDSLMSDKEMVSLTAQVTRSYSDNRYSKYRAHIAISSFGGRMKDRLDNVMMGHYKSWKGVRVFEENFVEVAEKAKVWMRDRDGGRLAGALAPGEGGHEQAEQDDSEAIPAEASVKNGESTGQTAGETAAETAGDEAPGAEEMPTGVEQTNATESNAGNTGSSTEGEVIYLTSDSENTLTHLSPYSVYIIGGLVDKNRYKGLCYKRARQHSIKTARLPIGQYMTMNSRKVLTTNHVNEIMLRWFELGDWGEAFMQVIPKRKGGELRTVPEIGSSQDDAENDDDGDVDVDLDSTIDNDADAVDRPTEAAAGQDVGDGEHQHNAEKPAG